MQLGAPQGERDMEPERERKKLSPSDISQHLDPAIPEVRLWAFLLKESVNV